MILCDTDIFIEALKNNPRAIDSLRNIGFENIALSAITVMELYFGAVNKREMTKIKNRLHIPDALIAATAICQRMELLTYNVKDFKFIKDISLYYPDK